MNKVLNYWLEHLFEEFTIVKSNSDYYKWKDDANLSSSSFVAKLTPAYVEFQNHI